MLTYFDIYSLSFLLGSFNFLSVIWYWGLLLIFLGVSMFKRLGGFWVILGFLSVGIGSAFWLSIWSISLLLIVSLLGFSVILWLLRYFTSSSDLYSTTVFSAVGFFLCRFFVNCVFISGFFNITDSVLCSSSSFTYLSSILFSIYWLSILCLLVWLATMLLIHMSSKVLCYNLRYSLGLLNYILLDGFLLLFLGVLLCSFPVIVRKCLSFNTSYLSSNIRELSFRWTSDIYECGITTTNSSFDEDVVSDLNMGMVRLLSFIYLFLLLDLEASVMLVGFYGGCLSIYLIFFMLCVLLSLACELAKDPIS